MFQFVYALLVGREVTLNLRRGDAPNQSLHTARFRSLVVRADRRRRLLTAPRALFKEPFLPWPGDEASISGSPEALEITDVDYYLPFGHIGISVAVIGRAWS